MIANPVSKHRLMHFLVPSGRGLNASAATRFALKLASNCQARLTLLHIFDDDPSTELTGLNSIASLHRVLQFRHGRNYVTPTFDRAHAKRSIAQLVKANPRVHLLQRFGDLVIEIAEICREDPADAVIVQPSRRPWYSWFRRTCLAEQIQSATDCPVLLVPKRWKPVSQSSPELLRNRF